MASGVEGGNWLGRDNDTQGEVDGGTRGTHSAAALPLCSGSCRRPDTLPAVFRDLQQRGSSSIFPSGSSFSSSVGPRGCIRSTVARKELRQMASSYLSSVPDSDIRNCNYQFWLRHKNREAKKLWEMGKVFGLRYEGDEDLVVKRLVDMEVRDEEEARSALEQVRGTSDALNR